MTLTSLAIKMQLLYKEKENAFVQSCECRFFSLVFVIKLGGSMTEIFSVGLQKTDNQAIPGNDQNASPTNQKTAGSKLDRTS